MMMTLFDDDQIMEAYIRDVREEAAKEAAEEAAKEAARVARETVLSLAEMGLTVEQISQAVKVSANDIKEWLEERTAK